MAIEKEVGETKRPIMHKKSKTVNSSPLKFTLALAMIFIFSLGANAADVVVQNGKIDVASKLYVDDLGNVGIGTTGPHTILEVHAGTNQNFQILPSGSMTGAVLINAANDANIAQVPMQLGASAFSFQTGNVGIGTINPSMKLEVTTAVGLDGIRATDGSRWMRLMPGTVSSGSFNPLTQTNDNALIYSNGQIDTGALTIAQWSSNPRGIRIDSNGSVGIGTATPGISKTYIVNGGTAVGLYVGNGVPFGQAKLEIDGPTATHIWVAENTSRVFSVTSGGGGFFNGNLGVGNTNPTYKLDVAGQIRSSSGGFVFPDGSILTSAPNGSGSTQWGTNGSSIYYSSGNVGIGTTGPGYKLTLSGGPFAIDTSGNYVVDLGGNNRFRFCGPSGTCSNAGEYIGGRIRLSPDGSFASAENRVDPGMGGIHAPGNAFFATSSGNVGIGTSSPAYKLDVAGQIRSSSGGFVFPDGTTQITAASGAGATQWTTSGSNIYYNSGNVGIGTAAPGTKLDVLGNVRGGNADTLIGTHPTYGTGYSAFWRQGADYSVLTDGGNSFLNAPASAGNIYLRTANADKVFIRGSDGNVGIGTTAPGSKLTVSGNVEVNSGYVYAYNNAFPIRLGELWGHTGLYNGNSAHIMYFASDQYFAFLSRSGTYSPGVYAQDFYSVSAGAWMSQLCRSNGVNCPASSGVTGSGTANYLPKFATGTSLTNSVIYDNGNIGVGTTTTPYKLTVAGDVYANGGWMRVSGNQGLYFESWGGGWYMQDGTWIRAYNGKSVWVDQTIGSNAGLTVGYSGAGAPANGAIISGNVGIGTSSPAQKLHVVGGSIALDYNRAIGTSDGQWGLAPYQGGNLWLYTGGSPRITIGAGNNIGLGGYPNGGYTVYTSGTEYVSGSITAQIMYDANNGGYYSDPDQTSRLNSIVYNTASQASSRRIKTDIETSPYGMQAIGKLEPVTYRLINDSKKEKKIGLIAEDVLKVIPEIVSLDKEGNATGIQYQLLTPVLIKAVQEQQKQINEQQKQIDDMKNEISKIKGGK